MGDEGDHDPNPSEDGAARAALEARVGRVLEGRWELGPIVATEGWHDVERVIHAARDLVRGEDAQVRIDLLDAGARSWTRADFERRWARARPRLEAMLRGSRLDHPAIHRVHAFGAEQERAIWVAGDPLPRGTLLDHLEAEGGVLPVREAAGLLAPIAEALALAHRCGLRHGDVDLTRIVLAGRRAVLVGLGEHGPDAVDDFTWMPARPESIAPEEARGDRARIGAASEVYRVGAMLYELVTGMAPFARGDARSAMLAVLREPLVPPSRLASVPSAVDALVARAMAREPRARFASMDDLAAALDALAGDRAPA